MRLPFTQGLRLACVLAALSSAVKAADKANLESRAFQRKQLPLPLPFGAARHPAMAHPWFNPWPFSPAWGRGGLQLPIPFYNLPAAAQGHQTTPSPTTEATEAPEETTTTTTRPRRKTTTTTTKKPKYVAEPKSALVPPAKAGSQKRYSPYRYLLDQPTTTTTTSPKLKRRGQEEDLDEQPVQIKSRKKNSNRRSQRPVLPNPYIITATASPHVNPNFIRRPPSINSFLQPLNANFYLSGNPFTYLRPPPMPPKFIKTTTTTTSPGKVIFQPIGEIQEESLATPTNISPQYSFVGADNQPADQVAFDSWLPLGPNNNIQQQQQQSLEEPSSIETYQQVQSGVDKLFNLSASIGFGSTVQQDFRQGQVLADNSGPQHATHQQLDDLSAEGSSISSPAAASSSLSPNTVKWPLANFGNRDIHVDPNARIEQIFSLNRTAQLTPFAQFVKNNANKYRAQLPPSTASTTRFNKETSNSNFIEDYLGHREEELRGQLPQINNNNNNNKYYNSGSNEDLAGDTWYKKPIAADTDYITSTEDDEDDDMSAIPDKTVAGRFWDRNPWRPMPPFLRPDAAGEGSSAEIGRPFYGEADDPRLGSSLPTVLGQTNEIDRAHNKLKSEAGKGKNIFADSLPTVRPTHRTKTSALSYTTSRPRQTAPPSLFKSTSRFKSTTSTTTQPTTTSTTTTTTTTKPSPSQLLPFIVTSAPVIDDPVKKTPGESNELESQGAVESQQSPHYFFLDQQPKVTVRAKEASSNDFNGNRVRLQPHLPTSWSSTTTYSTPTSKKSVVLFFPSATPTQSMATLATYLHKQDKTSRHQQSTSSSTPSTIYYSNVHSTNKPINVINSDLNWSNRQSSSSSSSKDKRPWPFSSATEHGSSGSKIKPHLQIIEFYAPKKSVNTDAAQTQQSSLEIGDLKVANGEGDKQAGAKKNQGPADSTTRYYDLRGQEFSPEDVTFAAPHADHNTDEALRYWQRVVEGSSKHGSNGNKQVHYASIPVIKRKGDTLSWEMLEVPLYWNRGTIPKLPDDSSSILGFGLQNDTDADRIRDERRKQLSDTKVPVITNGSQASSAIFLSKELASSKEDDQGQPAAIYVATPQSPTATPAPPNKLMEPRSSAITTITLTSTLKPSSVTDDEDYDDWEDDSTTTEMPNIMDLFPEYDWMDSPGESKLTMSIPSSISIENLKLATADENIDDSGTDNKAKPKAAWLQRGLNEARQLSSTRDTNQASIKPKIDSKSHPQKAFSVTDRQDRNNQLPPGSIRIGSETVPKLIQNSNDLLEDDGEPHRPEKLQVMPDPLRPLNSEAVRRIKEFPDSIPGIPGVHYPTFKTIPKTDFNCSDQQWPGYYADPEADCQVWHLCAPRTSAAFLCPAGTLFNQAAMICDLWDNVPHCDLAPQLYYLNSLFVDIFLDASASAGPVNRTTSSITRR